MSIAYVTACSVGSKWDSFPTDSGKVYMPTGRGSNKTYGPYYFRFPWIFPW